MQSSEQKNSKIFIPVDYPTFVAATKQEEIDEAKEVYARIGQGY